MNLSSFSTNIKFGKSSKKDDELNTSERGLGSMKLGGFGGMSKNFSKTMSSAASALMGDDHDDASKTVDVADRAERTAAMSRIMHLMEDVRLQCPQTHAGLVVAFSGTTLSPITDSHVQFKWYRQGSDNEHLIPIDEGTRGWYPPTADDIGKKISVNCQDTLDEGYCRYTETGPVEADPFLCSMVETALQNGRCEVKDVSVSFGTSILSVDQQGHILSSISATGTTSTTSASSPSTFSFLRTNITKQDANNDFHVKERVSSLVSIPASAFLQLSSRLIVEVDHDGIFINALDTSSTGGEMEVRARKGLLIESSANLKISCTLPASMVIEIPLAKPQKVISLDDEANDDKTSVHSEGEHEDIASTYSWIGDPTGDIHHSIMAFIGTNGTGAAGSDGNSGTFKICIACADRMQRDSLVLSCRTMAGFSKSVGVRDRLVSLPWYAVDESGGYTKRVGAQSSAGSDLNRRLKELEDENALLKRQQSELTVQVLELQMSSSESYSHMSYRPTTTSTKVSTSSDVQSPVSEDDTIDNVDGAVIDEKHEHDAASSTADFHAQLHHQQQIQVQLQQQITVLKNKVREMEREIATARNKEIEFEKNNIESQLEIKKLQSSVDNNLSAMQDLTIKVSDSNSENIALKQQLDSSHLEMNKMKDLLNKADQDAIELNEAKNIIVEKNNSISQLRDRLLASESNMTDALSARKMLEEAKNIYRSELDVAQATNSSLNDQVETLTAELNKVLARNLELEEECKGHKITIHTLEATTISQEMYNEVEQKSTTLLGEKNHWQKKSESLVKDMRRVMKDSQDRVTELEKSLNKKSLDYEDLENKLAEMTREETQRKEAEELKKSKSIFSRNK